MFFIATTIKRGQELSPVEPYSIQNVSLLKWHTTDDDSIKKKLPMKLVVLVAKIRFRCNAYEAYES